MFGRSVAALAFSVFGAGTAATSTACEVASSEEAGLLLLASVQASFSRASEHKTKDFYV